MQGIHPVVGLLAMGHFPRLLDHRNYPQDTRTQPRRWSKSDLAWWQETPAWSQGQEKLLDDMAVQVVPENGEGVGPGLSACCTAQ